MKRQESGDPRAVTATAFVVAQKRAFGRGPGSMVWPVLLGTADAAYVQDSMAILMGDAARLAGDAGTQGLKWPMVLTERQRDHLFPDGWERGTEPCPDGRVVMAKLLAWTMTNKQVSVPDKVFMAAFEEVEVERREAQERREALRLVLIGKLQDGDDPNGLPEIVTPGLLIQVILALEEGGMLKEEQVNQLILLALRCPDELIQLVHDTLSGFRAWGGLLVAGAKLDSVQVLPKLYVPEQNVHSFRRALAALRVDMISQSFSGLQELLDEVLGQAPHADS